MLKVVAIAFTTFLASAAGAAPQETLAKRVEIVDEAGTTVAVLESVDCQPAFTFSAGKEVPDSVRLALTDMARGIVVFVDHSRVGVIALAEKSPSDGDLTGSFLMQGGLVPTSSWCEFKERGFCENYPCPIAGGIEPVR